MKYKKLLVTGGAGFIGSEFVRQAVSKGHRVVIVDNLTYAGSLERLKEVNKKFCFYKVDICNVKKINKIFQKEKPHVVVHFAAESHVDRSIDNPLPFIETNFKGTQVLLDAAKKHCVKKFLHLSTDEVYGEIGEGKFIEESPLVPNSPYSVSKAAADMLVRAYNRTYGLPILIARPCNNYGPWQYPEKLIPVIIKKALQNEKVPIYGKGINMREWLFVSDCARALFAILEKGRIGEVYNIGSGEERKNIDTAKLIINRLGKKTNLIKFVEDRPGHDIRYFLDSTKIARHTGWRVETEFDIGMEKTIRWYISHPRWRVL